MIEKIEREAFIKRTKRSDQGTFGTLHTDSGFTCASGELPWRDLDGNGIGDPNFSCINAGVFDCRWYLSPRFGYYRYLVDGVPGRSGILMHSGIWVGDTKKGFESHALGCIVLGISVREQEVAPKKLQLGMVDSRKALLDFENDLRRGPFKLTIVDAFG